MLGSTCERVNVDLYANRLEWPALLQATFFFNH